MNAGRKAKKEIQVYLPLSSGDKLGPGEVLFLLGQAGALHADVRDSSVMKRSSE